MTEKDATARLRRAVKENNLFLVKRLIQRTEMRNPDPGPRRLTSLAWAAELGHEETFEFLLTAGHDDEELSRDAENNTILMLLAELNPPSSDSPYISRPDIDTVGAALRMSRMYYDRYTWILDWSNVHGKTALHMAALKGNEELVRMLCDLGADFNLSDNKGNTPLHYASSWGHIPVVQLLIERGCQYAARNNDGFTASDYAYSFNTRDTLQDTARIQFENNKKSRRNVFAQAAARGNEWGSSAPISVAPPAPPPSYTKPPNGELRMRSGSGGSRTTTTSDSDSSPSFSAGTSYNSNPHHPLSPPSHTSTLPSPAAAIASRMRERDADAMEKYMRRNRSGSQSTDPKSQNGSTFSFSSAGPSANGDDLASLASASKLSTAHSNSGSAATARRILRPSVSAAQLRSYTEAQRASPTTPTGGAVFASTVVPPPPDSFRSRAGTSPTAPRPHPPALSLAPTILTRSASTKSSASRPIEEADEYRYMYGAESPVFARFSLSESPPPPPPPQLWGVGASGSEGSGSGSSPSGSVTTTTATAATATATTPTGRRLPFNLLAKTLSPEGAGHRRGVSAALIRGNS